MRMTTEFGCEIDLSVLLNAIIEQKMAHPGVLFRYAERKSEEAAEAIANGVLADLEDWLSEELGVMLRLGRIEHGDCAIFLNGDDRV